jgi:polar amino acid transport system substrate-binding protein
MFKLLTAVLVAVFMSGCATTMGVPAAAKAELAPTGKLRAGMNLSNTLFTQKNTNGQLYGVAVDVMNELGSRLGVPVEMIVHPSPGVVADAVNNGTWDVAVLAIEATRAQTISFSPPITAIEATYVVPRDSPLRSVEQVDSSGVRIAAPAKAGYELYLRQALKKATLVDSRDLQGSIDMINDRKVEAMAALKPMLVESMPKMPDARLLDGHFMTVNHGLATARGKAAADEYLKQFVRELNSSGFIARSIERHGIKGLSPVR